MRRLVGATAVVLVALASLAMVAAPHASAAVTIEQKVGDESYRFQIFGYSQLEIRGGKGNADGYGVEPGARENDDPFFDAQRIRLGTTYLRNRLGMKLQIDFNESFSDREGGLYEAIKDAYVSYAFSPAAFVKLGMFKTPVGMDFNASGWNLEIADLNGLVDELVLERSLGVMVSGRHIFGRVPEDGTQLAITGLEQGREGRGYGFGYDVAVFNIPERSGAVVNEDEVDALAGLVTGYDEGQIARVRNAVDAWGNGNQRGFALRVLYEHGESFYAEVYYGSADEAGGFVTERGDFDDDGTIDERVALDITGGPRESENYTVLGAGLELALSEELRLSGEYIRARGILGERNRRQKSWNLELAYTLTPQIELVFAHYDAGSNVEGDPIDETRQLRNTHLGASFFLEPLAFSPESLQSHRVQVNYVFTGGDDRVLPDGLAKWNGLGGYLDDAWVVQYQVRY